MTTTITHSNGRTTTHDTRDEAVAALRAQHPALYVYDDGSRTLAWADEASAEDDDGRRAVAELTESLPTLTFEMVEADRVADGLYLSDGVNPPSGGAFAAILVTTREGESYGRWCAVDGDTEDSGPTFLLAELLEAR